MLLGGRAGECAALDPVLLGDRGGECAALDPVLQGDRGGECAALDPVLLRDREDVQPSTGSSRSSLATEDGAGDKD